MKWHLGLVVVGVCLVSFEFGFGYFFEGEMLLIFVENPTCKKLKSKVFPSNPEEERAQHK